MTIQYVTSEHETLEFGRLIPRVRKIWKKWFLDMGAFSWQNATYTIQFILKIYINSEKLMLPESGAPVEFFSWKCGKLRKTTKSGYPALIWPFRTSLFSALSLNKLSHMNNKVKRCLKRPKICFTNNLNFLRIDRADYGASWTLSFALLDPFGGTNGSSQRNRNILFDVFCLRRCIFNFILSEYNILSARNARMIKMLIYLLTR